MGGTCPPEELLPQGKDGSPRSIVRAWEGGGRLRSQTRPDDWSVRQDAEEAPQDRQSLPRSSWGSTLGRPSGPQPMGTDGGSEADPGRGTHSRSELTTPHLSHLSQRTTFNNYCKKAKMAEFGRFAEFGGSGRAGPRNGPPEAPARLRDVGGRRPDAVCADCAVGSG